MLQSVLNSLGEESTRERFSSGDDEAIKLESSELDLLDELYKLLNPEQCDTKRCECEESIITCKLVSKKM